MHITFYGAVREVTGSMHLVWTGTDRILLDCGMFQGRRKEAEEKNRNLPIDPGILSSIVLSHAHIDHSGRIPMLTRRNFSGHIFHTMDSQVDPVFQQGRFYFLNKEAFAPYLC